MSVGLRLGCLVACLLAAVACKEEGTVTVHELNFKGVKAVDSSRLRSALATHRSSRLPWGKKNAFDRSRFDADLKRIQAFYADRGFPDARVTGFDVKLNDKQDQVDLTVTNRDHKGDQAYQDRSQRGLMPSQANRLSA